MYCSYCGKTIGDDSVFCQYCGARVGRAWHFASSSPHRPFARYSSDKKIAGVCGGVARYFGLDASLMRAIFLLTAVLWGTGLVVYLVLWIAMPLDPDLPPATAA